MCLLSVLGLNGYRPILHWANSSDVNGGHAESVPFHQWGDRNFINVQECCFELTNNVLEDALVPYIKCGTAIGAWVSVDKARIWILRVFHSNNAISQCQLTITCEVIVKLVPKQLSAKPTVTIGDSADRSKTILARPSGGTLRPTQVTKMNLLLESAPFSVIRMKPNTPLSSATNKYGYLYHHIIATLRTK